MHLNCDASLEVVGVESFETESLSDPWRKQLLLCLLRVCVDATEVGGDSEDSGDSGGRWEGGSMYHYCVAENSR